MYLSRFKPQIYAILRIVVGFLFLWHGSQKLFDFPASSSGMVPPAYIIWIGGTIEFFGGLLVMLGFVTRVAAFLASGEMAFAYWMAHSPAAILPLLNHGELAMLYCFLFLYISAKGAGVFSVDSIIEKKKQKRNEFKSKNP